MLKKCNCITAIWLGIITIFDTIFTGSVTLVNALFSHRRREIIYKWGIDWGKRALKRYKITVRVIGRENFQNSSGVLILSNHQSMLEAFLLSEFLNKDIVVIGKKSLKWIPGFGLMYLMSKQISLDRHNRKKAIEGLEIARKRITEGYSIFLAPEGTRSSTGKLGHLKKGFFHLALQTKAPILPLTFVNTYKLQPKHSAKINQGEAIMVFDTIIETNNWKPDEIDLRREELRQIYQNNLNKYGDPEQYVPLEEHQYISKS